MLTVENQRQTSLIAVLHLCLDIKALLRDFLLGVFVDPYQPVHCYIQHSLRRSQHILGTSNKLASVHLQRQDCFAL